MRFDLVRIRPLAALSIAALSAVLLTGCAGSADPAATPSGGPSASADLCAAAAPSGSVSEAVTVEGDAGAQPTVTFSAPLDITEVQRSVIAEGSGDPIESGDLVEYALTAFDAQTGELLGSIGFNPGESLPAPVTADSPLAAILGCASPGTRVVATFPQSDQGNALVYVVDLLGVTPSAAWGAPQAPVDGMPSVTVAADGTPSVDIPEGDAPTELKVAVLKKGDGPAVADGDTTLLQYFGADWATGESFDSSWSKGATPISSPGNQYVPGFVQALAGQTVGSQVLVVIPPALGYGEAGSSDHDLAGKTLVFVIDILATQRATPQQ